MTILVYALLVLLVLASAVGGYFLARQKHMNGPLWATICLLFPVFGFLIIWCLDTAEAKLPSNITSAHQRVLSTGRIPEEAVARLAVDEALLSEAVRTRASEIGRDAGEYFKRFFLASHYYLAPLGVSAAQISESVDADIARFKSRSDVRKTLSETANDADRKNVEGRKFFAAGHGSAILRKDGSVLVEEEGAVRCYLSMATYVDTARQWDGLVRIFDPSDIAFVRNLIFKTSSHANAKRLAASDHA